MKKKILFLYGPLNAGGAERVLLDFLVNLNRDKYDITLCLIVNGGTLLPEVPKDVKVITLWNSYSLYYKLALKASQWFGDDFLFKRVISQKIKKDYHFIISFLEGMPLKLHSLINNKAKNITWVHTDLHDFKYTEPLFYKKKEIAAYKKMDKIICVSEYTKDAFLKRFLTLATPVASLYNPVDSNKIIKLANHSTFEKKIDFIIVVVGRLTLPKRIDKLIYITSKFIRNNIKVKIIIVGDGELKEELQSLAKDLNVESLVQFVGYQSNPYPIIKNADLLVSTSAYEGFGLVLCEAMALGVPVVSTKTAGPMEIIGNNEFGLLCEHDHTAIYEAVLKMIEDKELRDYYIQKGYERVKDFSLEKALHQFDTLIEELS